MKISMRFCFLMIFLSEYSWCQVPIDVVESTIKVSGLSEEVFYYGFAEGDQLVFNFQELNGKELKELEITELPSSSKFIDYKASKIENKNLAIPRGGIFKFRFSNSALGGRVCKIKIQRIPTSEQTKNFNTTVYWRTLQDTTYIPKQEKFLERSDTIITTVIDQVAKISSQNAINGSSNKNIIDFYLPSGTVAWSYYIGVGKEGQDAYEAAKDKFVSSVASSISRIPEYGAMAALALTGINNFSRIQGRDNVRYFFITDWNNVQLFNANQSFLQYKQGDVINDASQMKHPLEGKVYLGLLNDNIMEPIEVVVKATTIQINQVFGTKVVMERNVVTWQEPYLKN